MTLFEMCWRNFSSNTVMIDIHVFAGERDISYEAEDSASSERQESFRLNESRTQKVRFFFSFCGCRLRNALIRWYTEQPAVTRSDRWAASSNSRVSPSHWLFRLFLAQDYSRNILFSRWCGVCHRCCNISTHQSIRSRIFYFLFFFYFYLHNRATNRN